MLERSHMDVGEAPLNTFDGLKIFSATMAKERAELGDVITRWLASHPECEVRERFVRQSSGDDYHCLTILLFYRTVQR